jgi:uncharacterized protein involved in exopolysaccharide biosynthesis
MMAPDLRKRVGAALAEDEIGIRVTLAQIRAFLPHYRWVIVTVFVLTVLSAYAALSVMTELYEARSALLVKLGRENLDAPPTANNTVLSTGVRREELGSEAQLLHSTDLLAQVVDELGADAFQPRRVLPPSLFGRMKFHTKALLRWVKTQYHEALIALDLRKRLDAREEVIALLQDELIVEPQKDADVIGLRLRLADPALAVRVHQTLINRYLARRIAVRQDAGARDFLERRADELRQALARAEHVRNEWKQTRVLMAPAEQKTMLLRQIREVSAEQGRTRTQREALGSEIVMAERLLRARPETVKTTSIETPNPAFQLLDERLTKLETDRAHLLSTYQSDASTVRVLEDEIANVKLLLAAQDKTQLGSETLEPNPLRQQLDQRLQENRVRDEGLAAAEQAQARQLADLELELGALEQADAHLGELERDRQVAEVSYLSAVKRRDEANIDLRLDLSRISNVSVAAPPVASLEPVYPRKLLIMLIAIALGLALGVSLAIALEWTSDAARDPEQIESLTELVCLGSVTHDRRPRDKVMAWRR